MGKSQRTKGHAFERHVANELAKVYPGAKRGIGQARDAREVPDVDGSPFWVECKVGVRPNVYAAYKQAEAARDDRPSLVVTLKNQTQPGEKTYTLATLELSTLLELLGELDKRMDRWPFWGREGNEHAD